MALTPATLRDAMDALARQHPDAVLVKNEVGNLAILIDDPEESYLGFVNLRTGEVELAQS